MKNIVSVSLVILCVSIFTCRTQRSIPSELLIKQHWSLPASGRLLVNKTDKANFLSDGYKVRFPRRLFGIVNQGRVGRRSVTDHERYSRATGMVIVPRPGRSASLYPDAEIKPMIEFGSNKMIDIDKNNGNDNILNDKDINDVFLTPVYLLSNGKLWFHPIADNQS